MIPPPGRYRLVSQGPPVTMMDVSVTPTGMYTPVGWFAYAADVDLFIMGEVAVRCLGDGRYRAINGALNIEGTCVFLGP